MAQEEIVKFNHVWAYYNHHPALQDINFVIHERDFLGIIGPNGGGKTTLLKIILGLLKPRRGSVTVLGKDPSESRSQIGYVPQKSYFDKNRLFKRLFFCFLTRNKYSDFQIS